MPEKCTTFVRNLRFCANMNNTHINITNASSLCMSYALPQFFNIIKTFTYSVQRLLCVLNKTFYTRIMHEIYYSIKKPALSAVYWILGRDKKMYQKISISVLYRECALSWLSHEKHEQWLIINAIQELDMVLLWNCT